MRLLIFEPMQEGKGTKSIELVFPESDVETESRQYEEDQEES